MAAPLSAGNAIRNLLILLDPLKIDVQDRVLDGWRCTSFKIAACGLIADPQIEMVE